jgi:hypothetical protein
MVASVEHGVAPYFKFGDLKRFLSVGLPPRDSVPWNWRRQLVTRRADDIGRLFF